MIKNLNFVIKEFYKNNGYLTSKQMVELGIKSWHVQKLIGNGIIERVKRGIYRLCNFDFDMEQEEICVMKMVPKGIFCLMSALALHGLTTYIPNEYQLAIDRRYKVRIPDYPPVKVFYFNEDNYRLGIEKKVINGQVIKVYNMEKTLCDCIRYRNKLDKNIISEAFKEYLRRSDRDLNLLMRYSQQCKVDKIIKIYMEVLI